MRYVTPAQRRALEVVEHMINNSSNPYQGREIIDLILGIMDVEIDGGPVEDKSIVAKTPEDHNPITIEDIHPDGKIIPGGPDNEWLNKRPGLGKPIGLRDPFDYKTDQWPIEVTYTGDPSEPRTALETITAEEPVFPNTCTAQDNPHIVAVNYTQNP